MTYKIDKSTPSNNHTLPFKFTTLLDARAFLRGVRQSYADDAPHGMKCERAHWSSDCMSIICEETNALDGRGRGDKHIFTIYAA